MIIDISIFFYFTFFKVNVNVNNVYDDNRNDSNSENYF
jgi:hypothetical protein